MVTAMAKHNATGRSNGELSHIRLYHWEYNCPAFRALSPNAKAVYLAMRGLFNGRNNGHIAMSARNAGAVCHASKSTGARALHELIDLGFIRITKASAFNMKQRLAAEYELTAIAKEPQKKVDKLRAGTKEFKQVSGIMAEAYLKSGGLKKPKIKMRQI